MFFFNKESKKTEKIQTTVIKKEVKVQTITSTVNKFGETVTTSTSPVQIIQVIPQVQNVITQIKEEYQVDVTSSTKIVEVKGKKTSKEIKIVSTSTETNTETTYTSIFDGKTTNENWTHIRDTQSSFPVYCYQIIIFCCSPNANYQLITRA